MAQTEKTRLRQFIESESSTLLGTLRYYLFRAGLNGRGLPLESAAQDLLNDVVEEALEQLSAKDRVKADLVKLRFFAGMRLEEAGSVLGISEPTAKRYWAYARVWLYDAVERLR